MCGSDSKCGRNWTDFAIQSNRQSNWLSSRLQALQPHTRASSANTNTEMISGFKSQLTIIAGAILLFTFYVASSGAEDRRALRAPFAIARDQSIARVPTTNRLDLVISLPVRNRVGLERLINDIYNPASPNFHKYLSVKQFTDEFGPSEQDYQTVRHWAETNGFTVRATHPNRLLLDVCATAADLEKTFRVKMGVYRHPTEPRTYYAPDTDPSLDSTLPILGIGGFNNFSSPRPVSDHSHAANVSSGAQPLGGTGSGPGGVFAGADFRAAYAPNVTLTGAGQSVALVQFDGYHTSDILAYESSNGLPSVTITNILLDGATGAEDGSGADSEVSGDIEMVMAMSPGAQIMVYEAPNIAGLDASYGGSAAVGFLDILNRIATDNSSKQISCSWGVTLLDIYAAPDFLNYVSSVDQTFEEFEAQGQSFFQAAGDFGAWYGGVNIFGYGVFEPLDNPYITLVGGTSLTTSGPGGSYISETVWNMTNANSPTLHSASAGGVSSTYAIPQWQQGIAMASNQGSINMRNIPDVAAVAINILVMAHNGSSLADGGTSYAAPLWAGFIALVNQQAAINGQAPIGFANPVIYRIGNGSGYSSAFHDISTGSNTNFYQLGIFRNLGSQTQFFAVPGYDLCSGWGTPAGQSLISALVASPDPLDLTPMASFAASGPVGGPFNITSQTYVLTNSGTSSIKWGLVNTSAWLNVSSPGGTLEPAGSSTSNTVSLSLAAASLVPGVYCATVWATNLTSGTAQSFEFTLEVGQPLVKNEGFETGDLAYWLGSAGFYDGYDGDNYTYWNDPFPSVGIMTAAETVHSGTYSLEMFTGGGTFLPNYATNCLSQTLPTLSGQLYLISFWLFQEAGDGPNSPPTNEFAVFWNGTSIFDQVYLQPTSLMNQRVASASGTSTVLQFRATGSYIYLSDLSVTPIPPVAFQTVTQTNGQIAFSWNAVTNLTYQLQYTTNLSQMTWTNIGQPIMPTNPSASAFDFTGPDPQRFYRLVLLP
jgi:hypothetical protein